MGVWPAPEVDPTLKRLRAIGAFLFWELIPCSDIILGVKFTLPTREWGHDAQQPKIQKQSNLASFLAAVLTPFALLFGIAIAHLPFIIWPQYDELSTDMPIWLVLIEVVLGYSVFAPVVFYGTVKSVQAIKAGSRWAWLPMLWFAYLIIWQVTMAIRGGG